MNDLTELRTDNLSIENYANKSTSKAEVDKENNSKLTVNITITKENNSFKTNLMECSILIKNVHIKARIFNIGTHGCIFWHWSFGGGVEYYPFS